MKLINYLITLLFCLPTTSKSQDIILNHSLLVVDSSTYQAIVQSDFLNKVSFSHEKQLKYWKGFYLIGKDNYLELFNPNSFEGYPMPVGDTWICLAALKSKTIQNLSSKANSFIEYDESEAYHQLSYMQKDSSTPITTREMKKEQYESWTKKTFTKDITFLSTDYNSKSESDSSSNYTIKNITKLDIKVNPSDSIGLSKFLMINGFHEKSRSKKLLVYSNKKEEFRLFITPKKINPQLFKIHFSLNKEVKKKSIRIGKSKFKLLKDKASWIFY